MGAYTKRLEGIRSTAELEKLILTISDESFPDPFFDEKSKDDSLLSSLTIDEARTILTEFNQGEKKDVIVIPLSVIKSMRTILASDEKLMSKLEDALNNTSLVFTEPPLQIEDSPERKKFKRRMERLKLRAEENKYKKLTNNLDTTVADDAQTKSMTFAASVGLNMIIAPISFGAFMYFFAGQIFSWVSGDDSEEDTRHGNTDIRRVITGVISGVGMLFVEMILFVIRTHTFDKEMRKKAKKKSVSPFGRKAIDQAPKAIK